jgi:hypothetical protein
MDYLVFAKKGYFLMRQIYLMAMEYLFVKQPVDCKKIPIVINNYNRLSFLKMLIANLEKRGYENIYIIDNHSTYPPLLEYYNDTPYHVFRLDKNWGYLSFWKSGIYKQFRNQYFVYTDSDIIPISECPDDFLSYFYSLMKRYPRASKIGFGLRIDDLPSCFRNKKSVIEWESQFWQKEIEYNVYLAPIDTTFALYRPNAKGPAYFHDFMLRTGGIYQAKHLPWYNDDDNLSEEETYYISVTKTSTHWTKEYRK